MDKENKKGLLQQLCDNSLRKNRAAREELRKSEEKGEQPEASSCENQEKEVFRGLQCPFR